MLDFVNTLYYGNTLGRWTLSLSLIVLSVIAGRVLYWIFRRWIAFLTRKTKTTLDDLIIQVIEQPLILVITLWGVWFSLKILSMSEDVAFWVDNLFRFFVTITITWFMSRLYDVVHQEYIAPLAAKTESDLDDQLMPVLKTGIKTIVWTLGIIIGLNNAGYNVTTMLAGLGIGGLAFALAAQDTIANIFGGITVLIQQPFKLNDEIIVGSINGYVRQIGLRSSLIETKVGTTIMVPNKMFAEQPLETIHYSETKYRVYLYLPLAYNTSADQMELVIQLIRDVAYQNEYVKDHSVYIRFDDITNYSFDIKAQYEIKEWQAGDEKPGGNPKHKVYTVKTQMNLEILKQLEANNIKLALPVLVQDTFPKISSSSSTRNL